MKKNIPLSIYIRTHNEEKRIGPVVKRAIQTGAEVIVIDDGSDDKTQEIAENNGAIVVQHKWAGRGKQKRFAEDIATHKWLLDIDADELLSEDLILEIINLFNNGSPDPGIYKIKYIIIELINFISGFI